MELTAQSCAEAIGWALRTALADERYAAVKLAEEHGFSKKAADNWIYGVNLRPLHKLIAIAAKRPAVKVALLKLITEAEEQLKNVEMDRRSFDARGCVGKGSSSD